MNFFSKNILSFINIVEIGVDLKNLMDARVRHLSFGDKWLRQTASASFRLQRDAYGDFINLEDLPVQSSKNTYEDMVCILRL